MKHSLWLVLFICVVSVVAVWLGVGMDTVYQNFDGPYYVAIAKSWYNPEIIRTNFSFPLPLQYYPAHFPLYPILIGLIGQIGLMNKLQAMVIVNLAASVAGAVVIYKIWERMKWGNPFWISTAWLFLWPRMWAVRSVGSPETLFIVFIVASLHFFSTKKYWLAAILGSLAVLTKSPGILLLVSYLSVVSYQFLKTRKIEWRAWPVGLIGLTLIGLFYFYQMQTGDFWAYFKTGDNIHLSTMPFRIFDSNQPWVGDWWLEDVLWIYLVAGIGVYRALKKNVTWGTFGAIFYMTILFVSHRDIARYSLPLVPIVLLGLSELFERKEVRWTLVLLIMPMFLYTLNFVAHNVLPIGDWAPFL